MQYIIEVTKQGFEEPLWVQDWGIDCETCRSVCREKWAARRCATYEEAEEITNKIPDILNPTIHEVNFEGDFEVEVN